MVSDTLNTQCWNHAKLKGKIHIVVSPTAYLHKSLEPTGAIDSSFLRR